MLKDALDYAEVKAALENNPIEEVICMDNIYHWFGNPELKPYGNVLELLSPYADMMLMVAAKNHSNYTDGILRCEHYTFSEEALKFHFQYFYQGDYIGNASLMRYHIRTQKKSPFLQEYFETSKDRLIKIRHAEYLYESFEELYGVVIATMNYGDSYILKGRLYHSAEIEIKNLISAFACVISADIYEFPNREVFEMVKEKVNQINAEAKSNHFKLLESMVGKSLQIPQKMYVGTSPVMQLIITGYAHKEGLGETIVNVAVNSISVDGFLRCDFITSTIRINRIAELTEREMLKIICYNLDKTYY